MAESPGTANSGLINRLLSPRHLAFWTLLASVATVIGLAITVGALLPDKPQAKPLTSQPSVDSSRTTTPSPTAAAPTPSAASPSAADSVLLSTLQLPQPQGQTGNLTATSVQIGTTTFPNSIRFTCSAPGFGSGSITYTVAGQRFLNATVGVPNDAPNGVNNSATIKFLKDGTTNLSTPLLIVVGQPRRVHLDLQNATQLQIVCASKSNTGLGAPMDIALGDATLTSS